MTPTHKTELLKAVEEGNDVRIVTLALQAAAHAARERRQDEAIAMRTLVDDYQSRGHAEKEYKKLRLQVAAQLYTPLPADAFADEPFIKACAHAGQLAVERADALIKACAVTPIPE